MFASSQCGSFLAFVAYFSVFFIDLTSGQSNYCNICPEHTLCLYPRNSPASQCYGYNSSGLITDQDITAIVNKHNQLRTRVAEGQETAGNPGPQPPASNMKMMHWDTELATIAQRWAYQCIFAHDACRNVARFQVGQNILNVCSATGQTSETVETMVQSWYDEVRRFNRGNVPRYQFSPGSTEYSQLVWATTSSIGCGRVRYMDTGIGVPCTIFICNYGPGGNLIGQSVYTTGQAGSNCPSGVSNQTSSLCN